jgi:hypothetical protein
MQSARPVALQDRAGEFALGNANFRHDAALWQTLQQNLAAGHDHATAGVDRVQLGLRRGPAEAATEIDCVRKV